MWPTAVAVPTGPIATYSAPWTSDGWRLLCGPIPLSPIHLCKYIYICVTDCWPPLQVDTSFAQNSSSDFSSQWGRSIRAWEILSSTRLIVHTTVSKSAFLKRQGRSEVSPQVFVGYSQRRAAGCICNGSQDTYLLCRWPNSRHTTGGISCWGSTVWKQHLVFDNSGSVRISQKKFFGRQRFIVLALV